MIHIIYDSICSSYVTVHCGDDTIHFHFQNDSWFTPSESRFTSDTKGFTPVARQFPLKRKKCGHPCSPYMIHSNQQMIDLNHDTVYSGFDINSLQFLDESLPFGHDSLPSRSSRWWCNLMFTRAVTMSRVENLVCGLHDWNDQGGDITVLSQCLCPGQAIAQKRECPSESVFNATSFKPAGCLLLCKSWMRGHVISIIQSVSPAVSGVTDDSGFGGGKTPLGPYLDVNKRHQRKSGLGRVAEFFHSGFGSR